MAAGVEGLIHISELSTARVGKVSDVLSEGQTVQAKVLSVDEGQRRMALSIKQHDGEPAAEGASEPERPAKSTKRKKPLKGGFD